MVDNGLAEAAELRLDQDWALDLRRLRLLLCASSCFRCQEKIREVSSGGEGSVVDGSGWCLK